MNFKQCVIFREIAKTENFTKAAANLFLTQSAVSHAVRELEDEAGTRLFERLHRTVKLTKTGELFLREILPVLDNLERALDVKVDDQNVKNYAKGFEMIYQQLVHILNQEGVKEIEALDKPFDPNFHQALMQEAVEGVEPGMVVEVLQKGYMLKDRVLRATLVKVSE